MAESSARTGNLLLDAVPPDVREAVLAGSTVRQVAAGDVLVEMGDAVEVAFFPLRGTLSMLTEPDNDTTVEASSNR